MSSPGLQPIDGVSSALQGRTPLGHLLHALNQPLTGLQCVLELAAVRPHLGAEYASTLREALDLTARMRVLVEALREIADMQASKLEVPRAFSLHDLVSATVQELLPVADAIEVELEVQQAAVCSIVGDRALISNVVFRLLDSALSLAEQKTALRIVSAAEGSSALLRVAWVHGPAPDFCPFSRQELGLFIAQAKWQRAGGAWNEIRTGKRVTCELRIPFQFAKSCRERTCNHAEMRDRA